MTKYGQFWSDCWAVFCYFLCAVLAAHRLIHFEFQYAMCYVGTYLHFLITRQ